MGTKKQVKKLIKKKLVLLDGRVLEEDREVEGQLYYQEQADVLKQSLQTNNYGITIFLEEISCPSFDATMATYIPEFSTCAFKPFSANVV